ncbi:hypothetical protein GCM10010405_55770 [Streptomyces macrosporus]|uniref:Uncharacterized protein n=1 Tax=Streptomyces macrosporus TaxID=44032 RepID=A0ABN3KJZ8_9ACTN
MRSVRQFDLDRVAGAHHAAGPDDAHHPGLADDVAVLVAADDLLRQARPEVLDPEAGVAQSGELHDRLAAEAQQRARGRAEQVDAAGGDVLAELPRPHVEPRPADLVEQLLVDQVHLAQVRLGGVLGDARAVLDRHPRVDVPLHPEPGEQRDAVPVRLGERVRAVAADRRDRPAHRAAPLRPWHRCRPVPPAPSCREPSPASRRREGGWTAGRAGARGSVRAQYRGNAQPPG